MQANDSGQNHSYISQGRDLIVGQKLAFAAASLTLGICSFISLLGMEKAILAIVFGVLAMRNGKSLRVGRLGLARFGLALGILHIVLIIVLLVVFREELMRVLEYLERFDTAG